MVLTDLIARHQLPIAIGTLDTGKLHARDAGADPAHRGALRPEVEVHAPRAEAVVHFVRQHGERRDVRSIELRKACCELRKLRAAGAHAGRRAAPGSPACAASSRHTAARCPSANATHDGPHQVQPAGRLELGRRLALHRHARRALQPAARPVLPEHRLRALHARHRASARTSAPAAGGGKTKARRNAACMSHKIATKESPRMNAPLSIEQPAARARPQPPRLAGGRSHLHPARGRRQPSSAPRCCSPAARIPASCCAWPRRPSSTAVQRQRVQGPPALPAAARGHRPQLPRSDRVPRPARRRDGRAPGGRPPRGFDRARHGAPGAPAGIAQRPPDRDAARSHRGTPLRLPDRRRAPRRGEGARQGTHLQPPRQLRPVAAQGAAPRAVDAVQHAHPPGRALPRLPDQQLDRARRVAVHRAREHPAARRCTTRTSARWCGARACWCR